MRILHLEDNLVCRFIVRMMLKELDCEVVEAESVPIAIFKLEQEKFDLAILDYTLKCFSVEKIVDLCESKGVPYIFATARYKEEMSEYILSKKPIILMKPIDIDALQSIVSVFLKKECDTEFVECCV